MVRSVDVRQIIVQTNSIERIQQVQQQHPDVQQRYFEDQLNKEKREIREKVKNSHEVEHAVIKDEDRRNSKEEKFRDEADEKGRTDGDDADCIILRDERGGTVDIKV